MSPTTVPSPPLPPPIVSVDDTKNTPKFSKLSKISIVHSLASGSIIIGMESIVANLYIKNTYTATNQTSSNLNRNIIIYLVLFIMAQVFQSLFLFDSLWNQNLIQILAHALFCMGTFGYSIFQYNQLRAALSKNGLDKVFEDVIDVPLIVIITVLALSEFIYLYLTYRLYLEFGWKIYKKIGADRKMKSMYLHYQIFFMLLKSMIFFFVTFLVQFLVLLETNDPEFWVSILLFPVGLAFAYFAGYGLRREDWRWMLAYMVACIMSLAYFGFKLWRFNTRDEKSRYQESQRFLSFFGAITIVIIVFSCLNAYLCMRDFGKGLKQQSKFPSTTTNLPTLKK